MKERPIIFSGPMVSAILAGRKTQTRRVIKLQPDSDMHCHPPTEHDNEWLFSTRTAEEIAASLEGMHTWRRCPYGQPGDRLWVRETWAKPAMSVLYKADIDHMFEPFRWRPSIHMPRWASRITLEVTDVRVQRVQEISKDDAIAEGATRRTGAYWHQSREGGWSMDWSRVGEYSKHCRRDLRESDICLGSARMAFANYWIIINAKRGFGWEANPWVWVINFRVMKGE